jgi:hypothetical protein
MVTGRHLHVTLYIRHLSCYIMRTNFTVNNNYAPGANGQLCKSTISFSYPNFLSFHFCDGVASLTSPLHKIVCKYE